MSGEQSAAWPIADQVCPFHRYKKLMTDSTLGTYPGKFLLEQCKSQNSLLILYQNILDLIQQASHYRQLKKGANEGYLSSGHPPPLTGMSQITLRFQHLLTWAKLLCEDKNVPYVYVPSKIALGRATGVSRAVIAASITTNEASDLMGQIRALKDKV
ncbi:MAG: hypothetical protein Q9213_001733 [Squamulea squamosa]